ncbi:MAG: InlB B-repeat-containing protein, partial [Christensenellales bacterium]
MSTTRSTFHTDEKVKPALEGKVGFTSPAIKTIIIGAVSETVVDYYYVRNQYNVSITKDVNIENVQGAGTYYYGASVTIKATTKNGYDFNSWTGYLTKDTPTITITMPSDNVELYASSKLHYYTISYELNGGTYSGEMRTSYSIEDNSFTISIVPTKSGYSFTGWRGTNIDTTAKTITINKGSTGDRSYSAVWNIVDYTITYNLNSGVFASGGVVQSYTIETDTFDLMQPMKTGYTFMGWSGTGLTGSNNMKVQITKGSTGNKEFTANWMANEYLVTFDYSGATGGIDDSTVKVTFDSSYGSLPVPIKYGYNFEGWYSDSNFVNKITSDSIVSIASNHNLYAKFVGIQVTVSFVLNGGTMTSTSKKVNYGGMYGDLEQPTRQNFNFMGWYSDSELTNKVLSTTQVANANNHSLYAKWEKFVFTVFYNTTENGGTNTIDSINANVGDNVDLTKAGVKNGWTFVGWNTDKNATSALSSLTMPEENVILYAIYSKNIVLNVLNDKATSVITKTIYNNDTSATFTVPAMSSKASYEKLGWKVGTVQSTVDNSYDYANTSAFDITLNANATIYAKYKKQISLTYNANGGDSTPSTQSGNIYLASSGNASKEYGAISSQTFTLANAITRLATAEKTFTFKAWAINSTSGTQYSAGATLTTSTDNIMYAVWTEKINKYTITINVNNSNYGSVNPTSITNVPYGASITVSSNKVTINGTTVTATANSSTSQYTFAFSSWSNASGTVTGARTITANFTRTTNTYTVTINVNNSNYGSVSTT